MYEERKKANLFLCYISNISFKISKRNLYHQNCVGKVIIKTNESGFGKKSKIQKYRLLLNIVSSQKDSSLTCLQLTERNKDQNLIRNYFKCI